jgi:hypothetical protein
MAVFETMYRPEHPAQTARGTLGQSGVLAGEDAALRGRRLGSATGKHRRLLQFRAGRPLNLMRGVPRTPEGRYAPCCGSAGAGRTRKRSLFSRPGSPIDLDARPPP